MTIQSFDFHSDMLKAMLWQYENSDNIKALAQYKSAYFNRATVEFWRNWYRDVFNIDTANDFGLAVWGRLLGVPLGIDVPPSDKNKPGYGFGANKRNFKSNFRRNADYTLTLTTAQKRMLVRMRYFTLTESPTITNINAFLQGFFSDKNGKVFVLDPLDMSYIWYVFNFNPDERLRLLLDNFDLLPRPSGVGAKYRIVTRQAFGFGENRKNFTNNFGN